MSEPRRLKATPGARVAPGASHNPLAKVSTLMAARRDLDRYGVPGWVQAAPFALVFAAFFVLPLVFVVIVSFWDYNDYQMLPTFTTRSYVESFDGCLTDLPNLCTMFKTYVSTAKFCFIVWALTLVIGFTVAYFLAFHVRSRRRCRWCCSSSAPSRSGRRTSSA